MLKTIEVVFDGKMFVPTEPVDLPAGTKLSLRVPEEQPAPSSQLIASRPRPMTEEETKKWEELCRHCETTPPTPEEEAAFKRLLNPAGPWETVEEALGRPRQPSRLVSNEPPPLTEEEKKEWEEIRRQGESMPFPWASVEEAISYSRGRPWPKYEPMPELDDTSGTSDIDKEGQH